MLEMPALERLHQILEKKGFTVVAVNMDTDTKRSDVEKFVQNYGLSFPVILKQIS